MADYAVMRRNSGGDLTLISYHPRSSQTWHWSVCLTSKPNGRWWINRAADRRNQWHDYYRLPFGYQLIISQQDYHKQKAI